MLKIVCTVLTVFIFSNAFSQIDRGAFLIGADFSFGKTKTDYQSGSEGEQKVIMISASVSTAVKSNLEAGVDVTYSGFEYEDDISGYTIDRKDMGAGLFVRPYKTIVPSLMVFLQGRIGYIDIDREYGYNSSPSQRETIEGSNVSLSFMPGITYKAGKSILIELAVKSLLTLEMENTKTTSPSFGPPQVTKHKTFNISSGNALTDTPLSVGIRFIL